MKKFFQNKIKLLISLTFLILFVFNTVAYSGLATKLAITSEAKFRPITDIRVTDIKLDSATNGAVESYSPKFNVDTTTTGFVLPNVNSTITYKVKVTNYGNVNQTIYNFIKNSINSSNVNIKITDFTSVCADDSCSQKNSDFTIIHHNGDNTTDSNEKEILITFSTSAPSDQAINVIEKYDFRPIYNINYDANGGQNAPKSQIKIYKDNLTLTTDEPTRPSYKFLGWSTSSKSTTAEYKAGDSYNPGTNEEVKDIILYAVWKIDSYTLTINPNGGTWNNSTNKSTITQSYGSTYIIENPTKTGYTFTGWTLSGKGSLNGTTYTFGEGAATLTANYTANTYTITLDNKSATTAGTTAIYEKYGAGIYLDSALKNVMTTTTNKITVPAKTGYTFKGYYTKENGQGDQIINENGYITDKATNTTYIANTTLYAYYKDETKPTLTLTNSSNGNWTNKDVTIILNGADSGSGIKEYQWKENGAWTTRAIAITNGVGSITYTVDRNLEIEFRTIDNAGNVSDTKTTYVRRDTITPKIELNGAASSSEINNNSVTIPIKITETASGINNSEFTASDVSVLINGTKVNPSTKTLTYNSVSNGIYSYTLTLSGITLNGKVTLEIAAGAVKDIATNSNSKTTLDPSITVSNIYTISLNGNGTPAIYEKYNTGIYLDSALTSAMTTSANPITKPIRSYTVSFNANNTGITMPSAITKSYSYSGHYTDATNGTQMINENGYITSSFTKTSYTSNGTLYAHWKAKPSVTIPSISKTGYTCSWNTSADGKGTTYNAGDVTDKLNTQTLYAVCKANSYTVSYNSNGGSGTMTNDTATYDSNFITKKNTFTKTGYTFNGWNEKTDGTGTVWGLTTSGVYESGKTWKWTYTKNITLYAQWKANTNTKYVVKHYKQKLDGTYPSEADDTDNLTGTADSSVSPAIKSYAGFTAPSVQTVTISADGSTVVTYKYTRNKYTFTLGSTTGITTTGSTASGSYYYGSTITLKASANTGYIFTGWTSSNTNLVANQTNASATFTMPAGNITMTPSTGYTSYTVTYDATTNGGSTAKQTASTKYKSLVDLTKKAEKSGYEFVGWNTNKDATSALSSYEMPAKNVTLYAIYKKTLTATFNYYNSKSETKSVTIYNNATSGSITSPLALGTPSGYTFRHYSTSNVANAAKTIDANSAVVLTGNQTYYASYQKNVTLNFYYHSGTDAYANKQTSTTVTGVQYLGYNNAIVNSTVSIPSAVAGSTGYYGTSYKGVTAANSTTPISVNTGTTNYYAYYQATITYYYYNGSAHTTGAGTRTAYSNGTNYVTTASAAPTPSSYDGAAFKGWSYTNDSVNDRNPAYTAMTALYAYYQKTVNATFNYYDGSKAASVTAGNTKTYISKSGGVNTLNTNITIPDAAKASRGSYTYRGISTSNAANASVVTPTTANTTYYSSYTYAITANFTANGGTGTAPSSAAGTGYMNYSGSKIGISVTMPSNTFTRNGYTFGGWYDSVVNKTYTAGTSVTIDSTRDITVKWNANGLTFSNQSKIITYSESSQSFNISGASNGTGSYSYSIISGDTNGNFGIDGLTISTNKDKVPPTGTYQLTVRAKDINSGKTKDAIITVTIKPATITYTVSSYEGFYDGNSHTISVSVTKPTSGATITYSLTENGTYSATKPTVTNATTIPVTVYFKISASNYNTVSSKATITINKTNSVSPKLTAYSGTYDGKPHTIGVTGGSGGTIKYSTDQTNWSTTLPKRTDATPTPVTVYVKVFGDGNHKDTSIISSTITINKKTDVITMSSISTNYTGQKVEATATAESKTTITYTYYNGTTCSGTALSSAPVNVGDYSVKATSAGNNNYKSNSACATIKISNTNNPTTVSAVAGLKYGSTSNLLTTSNVQGTIYYSIGTELTSSNYKTSGSTSIPTASGKNAYTYKIYYYVDATGTNYESTKGGPVSVTISKADGSISYATKSVTKDYGNASFVNTLTKTGDGTITSYLSSNTGVATIDTSGKVTINAAGTTTIKATVTDGTNYTYATKTATYTLIVNQIDNTAKVSPVTGIIYGDSKSMVNVSEVQGTIYYSVGTEITEANYLSIGSTTIPASTGRNAGDYNIYYFVKGNSNYKNTSGSVKVTISAKALSIPVSPNAKTYNGNSQGSGISCPQGSTVGGATSATNQGTYTQTCTLNSTTNYVWDDTNKTTTPKSISWKIDPKKITITASNQTVTYGTAIDKSTSKVSVATLVSGHNLSAITLTQSTTNVPGGTISASGAKIVSGSTDVTSNYSMTYKTGTLTINPATLPAPTNIKISTAGIVTWDSVSNASSYQISMDNANWTAATSGVDYLSKLIASTGSKTVYVRAVGTGNYSTSNNGTASTIVYTVTVNSNSTTMGTVDTSSYNVISGATYSASSNKLSFIGTTTGSTTKTLKTVTATAKSNYTFNNWSSVSGSITSNVTLTANFNSSEFTISLNPNGGTGGTSAIYERYNKGIYLDSGTNSKQMTTSANAITKPTKEPYTISFNANNTGATVPSNYSFSPVFNGYYTATTSNGTQMIDNRGYITNNLTSTKYTSNTTLYAQWNHYYTLPSLSKGGNTCKWAIGSASGTKYNSGTSLFINDNKVFYAVCTPNKYKVKFEPNGGTSSATEMDVTYDSPYGTLPTVTRSASKVNDITINYVFEGWYDSNGTKITETSIVRIASDHTLYAHWLSSPNIKGGTAESWSSTAVTISLNIPSTSDTGTVSYQYYLSETNELPESATWIDITSADGSVSISKNGEFYIFYKATSSAGVSITSNYNKLQIDTQTPSTSITAYQAGTTTTVASDKWINKNLEFKMGALNVGPSGGSIYYCIGDSCTPNTLISPNTAIPADLTNTKTGIYKVRYKAVSNAGLSSSIGEYVAKVDKTAPTMKAVVKSLKDNSTLANLTNSSTTYIDSTWRSYGYSINLNGTTDSQSGISSIERFTNANNLKRADADYKANLHKGVITDTKTFSESGDGAKYAKFVATDNAGNTATFTVEVLIDKTAPTVGVNIYKAKDASTKTGSVICSLPNGCDEAFKWTSYGYYFDFSPSSDELSGIDYYTMRYTAGGKSSVDTSSYEERNVHSAYTTVTSSGARRLEFTATDKAGNTSTYVTKNIYIDMNDPNLVIKLYKADSSGNKTGSVLKTITDNNTAINSWTNYRHYFDLSGSSDSLSGIEKITMQINDSGIVTTGNTASGTSDLKTTYTITSTKHQVVGSSGNRYARFTITDKVGNTSVKNVRIYIDLDSPTLDSASLSPQFQSSTTIKYTCSDKTSGFASFGTKTLSKTYTKNVTSSNSPVKIQCKDTAGNTSSGTRTYTWSANSDKCGTTTEDVYSNGYYCDAGNAASANSSACISYATNTGKTTKYVNKRCMYYCNAKTGTTTVAKTCWHQ